MRAVKAQYTLNSFTVTDGDKVYTVEQGRITAHRMRHACRVYVQIDPAKFPKLAQRIGDAIARTGHAGA